MKDFASTISETVKHMGQAFFIAYYFPSMVLVLVHLYVLFPIWSGEPDLVQFWTTTKQLVWPSLGEVDVVSLIVILLLPIVVGMVFVGLNDILIYVFEGKVWWLKQGLLYPLLRLNQRKWEKFYGDLAALRREYQRVSSLVTDPSKEQLKAMQLASLAQQIDAVHNRMERNKPHQILPYDREHLAPTRFGNVYAIAEEYSYYRYGADAVLFWPHLRTFMDEAAPKHAECIGQQKVALDLRLNFAYVFGLLACESLTTLILDTSAHTFTLSTIGTVGILLFVAFYDSSVDAVHTLGELIKISFDRHRSLVLQSFDVQQPKDLSAEQEVWVNLAAFVRRGDIFYYPEVSVVEQDNQAEKEENQTLFARLKRLLKRASIGTRH
jgi:hypothetical protein